MGEAMPNRKTLISLVLFFLAGLILYGLTKILRSHVGCPPTGDCYLPAWKRYSILESLLIGWLAFSPFVLGVLCMRLLAPRNE